MKNELNFEKIKELLESCLEYPEYTFEDEITQEDLERLIYPNIENAIRSITTLEKNFFPLWKWLSHKISDSEYLKELKNA